jgi:hypothetical protein
MKKIYTLLTIVVTLFTLVNLNAQTAIVQGLGKSDFPFIQDSVDIYGAVPAVFGKRLHYNIDSLISGDVVIVKDKTGSTSACDTILDDLSGKIALIDRGVCNFDLKCYNAWRKGAIAIFVANGTTSPIVVMPISAANAAKAALIDIPCMMISNGQGAKIKAKIAADPNGYFAAIYQPNTDIYNAYPITSGTWFAPSSDFFNPFGPGAIGDTATTSATNAVWYKYTPSKTGKATISSCDKGTNTSLYMYELSGNNILQVGKSLDVCPKNAVDTQKEASELANIVVKAGTTYFIEWNDLASPDSFKFVLSFVKADSVDVTLRIDMKNEKVDAKGVHLAGSFQGWDPAKTLCDNVVGSSIWSKKIRVKSDDTYAYKFVNGDTWGKDESVSGACTAAGSGSGDRKISVKTETIDLAAVCFKSCDACVNLPLVCDADAIICDDFDKYTLGGLNAQSTNWDIWDGDIVNSGDGIVSNENSASGKNSLKIDGITVPTQDVIFDAGAKTKGSYILKHKMFVPNGKRAYYSVQHDITKAKHIWANDVFFNTNGSGNVAVAGKVIGTISYKHDTWFEVVQTIDIAKDTTTITVNGKTLGWKWSAASDGAAVVKNSKLGGFDFFADSTNTKYFVDDVQLIQTKQSVTFSVDMGTTKVDTAGVYIAGDFQKAAGFPGDWQPNTTKLTKGAGSIYTATVQIPDGDYQFKYINGNTWGKDESLSKTSCDAGGGNRGVSILGNTTLKTVCYSKCFSCDQAAVTFAIDLTNEALVSKDGVSIAGSFQKAAGGSSDWSPGNLFLNTAGKKIYTITVGIPVGKYEYKFLNGKAWGTDESVTGSCAATGGNRIMEVKTNVDLKLDTVCFKKCYSCDKKEVTFSVDMSLEKTISTDGISIAGSFQAAVATGAVNWSPGILFLKDNGKKIYSTTIPMPAGNYEYKFLNGKAWGTDEKAQGTCATSGGNRKITVGAVDTKLDTVCFNYCVSCKKVLYTNDADFSAAMSIYPNPAQNEVNLQYKFSETTTLNVSIINALGQNIYSTKMPNIEAGTATLNINNLSNGVYMIQITDEKQRLSVKRLVIQK